MRLAAAVGVRTDFRVDVSGFFRVCAYAWDCCHMDTPCTSEELPDRPPEQLHHFPCPPAGVKVLTPRPDAQCLSFGLWPSLWFRLVSVPGSGWSVFSCPYWSYWLATRVFSS